jgi:hypothetical protein
MNLFKGKETVRKKDPTAGEFHNSGYEHLKSIYFLKERQAKAPLQAASTYILPLMALKRACLAIEAYIDQTGQSLGPAWDEIDRQATSIREQIEYIFEKTIETPSFNTGVWKDVLALFETAKLIEGDLSEMSKLQRDEIPEEFKDIAVDYPIYRSQAIAEEAVEVLLTCTISATH